MIIRSAGLALLLATSMTQAETASIFSSTKIESYKGPATSSGRAQPVESDESATAPTSSAADRSDAISGKLSQISAELTRELEERLERVTEAEAFDALPAPVVQKAPSVASIHLP
jgi:hypothetical protein